jgi:hypothetical protein
MKKVIATVILYGVLLHAQQATYTNMGKYVNSECNDFCFLSFETRHGEQTYCVTERNYPDVSIGVLYNITWKKGVMKLQDVSPIHCQEIIKVKVVR